MSQEIQRLWEIRKEPARQYARREPERTDLYRVIFNFHEKLEVAWEGEFQQSYGAFREVVRESFNRYLSCGILAHGCAKAECQDKDCKHSILIAFSCKCRGICPSCGKKRGIIFAETLNEDVLLPVEQAHMVFTIPKRLRAFFRYDRNLNKLLFRSAWESVLELFEEVLPGCKPGCVLSLESSGELLNFNVHLHGLLTMGAFDSNGNFHPLPHIDPLAIQKLFQ